VIGWIHRQMQLASNPMLIFAVLAQFPLVFTKYFQAGVVDNLIGDLDLGRFPVSHLERAGTLADTGVIGRTQRHIHQRKQ